MTKDKVETIEIVFIVISSFLLIGALVVYAYTPPKENEPDKSGVIQILAAVVSGLITLYGVGMTIKFNRIAKREEDINKAKPNVFPIGMGTWYQLNDNSKIKRNLIVRTDLSNLEKADKTGCKYYFEPIILANSELSMCTFKGIIINDEKVLVFHYDNVLLKGFNYCFLIDYCFKNVEKIVSIQLVLGDMLGNTYSCYVSFENNTKKNSKTTDISITGALKTVLMDLNEFSVFK